MLGEDVEIRLTPMTRPTAASSRPHHPHDPQGGRQGADRPGRRAVEPVSARVDLARPFLAAGLPVVHRRLPRLRLPRHAAGAAGRDREAQALGISIFAGEAEEGRLDEVLRDAWNGTLKPLYNYMDKLPSLQGEPPPFLPRQHVRRTAGSLSSIDLGRGCPYQCSFCTIINVQGRKSRFRSPDDLEKIIRENYAQDIKRFFITDDNFARNKDWEILFDRLIALRESEFPGSASPSRSTRSATRSRTSSRRPRRRACAASSSGSRTSIPTI